MASEMARVLLYLPPARVSHEFELFRAMRNVKLITVASQGGRGADEEIVLRSRHVPIVGGEEGWTAAAAWLEGIGRIEPGVADVVVSLELFSFGTWQSGALARRLGIPHVVYVAENLADMPIYRVPPYRQITKRTARSAAAFICLTEMARDHAVALGCPEDRCVVIHGGVDTLMFSPAVTRATAPIVLFVGMLRSDRGADKGVMDIVDACALLECDWPGLKLRIVGEGHLRPNLEARARRSSFLSVEGRKPRTEVAEIMRGSRVLALASKRVWKNEEQFGYALVEAMASGLPIVCTRSGAIPEVVPQWNHFANEGDIAALARGIDAALRPEGDGLGQRNRELATNHYDLHKQADQLRETLLEVIENNALAGSSS
jgi:glycosyltransferase involved in cell wall biosynthesis